MLDGISASPWGYITHRKTEGFTDAFISATLGTEGTVVSKTRNDLFARGVSSLGREADVSRLITQIKQQGDTCCRRVSGATGDSDAETSLAWGWDSDRGSLRCYVRAKIRETQDLLKEKNVTGERNVKTSYGREYGSMAHSRTKGRSVRLSPCRWGGRWGFAGQRETCSPWHGGS